MLVYLPINTYPKKTALITVLFLCLQTTRFVVLFRWLLFAFELRGVAVLLSGLPTIAVLLLGPQTALFCFQFG
jgi:hypothetical protein